MDNSEIVTQVVQLKEIAKTEKVFDILNEAAVNLHIINQHAHNMLAFYLSTAVSAEEQLRSINVQEMQMIINAVIDAGQVVTRRGPKAKFTTTKDFWLTIYNEQYFTHCISSDTQLANFGVNYVAKMNKDNLLNSISSVKKVEKTERLKQGRAAARETTAQEKALTEAAGGIWSKEKEPNQLKRKIPQDVRTFRKKKKKKFTSTSFFPRMAMNQLCCKTKCVRDKL
jgi:hypothetical protein